MDGDDDVDAFLAGLGGDGSPPTSPSRPGAASTSDAPTSKLPTGPVDLDYASAVSLAHRLEPLARVHLQALITGLRAENASLGWATPSRDDDGEMRLAEPAAAPVKREHGLPASPVLAQREHALRLSRKSCTLQGRDAVPAQETAKGKVGVGSGAWNGASSDDSSTTNKEPRARALLDSLIAPGRARLLQNAEAMLGSLEDELVSALSVGRASSGAVACAGSNAGGQHAPKTIGAMIRDSLLSGSPSSSLEEVSDCELRGAAQALSEVALLGSSFRRALWDVVGKSEHGPRAASDVLSLVLRNAPTRWVLFGAVALGDVLSGSSWVQPHSHAVQLLAARTPAATGDGRALIALILENLVPSMLGSAPDDAGAHLKADAWVAALDTVFAKTKVRSHGWQSSRTVVCNAGAVLEQELGPMAAARRSLRWYPDSAPNTEYACPATSLPWTLAARVAAVLSVRPVAAALVFAASIEKPWAVLEAARAPPPPSTKALSVDWLHRKEEEIEHLLVRIGSPKGGERREESRNAQVLEGEAPSSDIDDSDQDDLLRKSAKGASRAAAAGSGAGADTYDMAPATAAPPNVEINEDIISPKPDSDRLAERILDITDSPSLCFMLADKGVWSANEGDADDDGAGALTHGLSAEHVTDDDVVEIKCAAALGSVASNKFVLWHSSAEGLGRTLALAAGVDALWFVARHFWSWSAFDDSRWRSLGGSPVDVDGGMNSDVFDNTNFSERRNAAVDVLCRLADRRMIHLRALATADPTGSLWARMLISATTDPQQLPTAVSPFVSSYAPHRRFLIFCKNSTWFPAWQVQSMGPPECYKVERRGFIEHFSPSFGAPEDFGEGVDRTDWDEKLARGMSARSAAPFSLGMLRNTARTAVAGIPPGTFCQLESVDYPTYERDFSEYTIRPNFVPLAPTFPEDLAVTTLDPAGRANRIAIPNFSVRAYITERLHYDATAADYRGNDAVAERLRWWAIDEKSKQYLHSLNNPTTIAIARWNTDSVRAKIATHLLKSSAAVARGSPTTADILKLIDGHSKDYDKFDVKSLMFFTFNVSLFDALVASWFEEKKALISQRRQLASFARLSRVAASRGARRASGGASSAAAVCVEESPLVQEGTNSLDDARHALVADGLLLVPSPSAPIHQVPGWPRPEGGASPLERSGSARLVQPGAVIRLDRGMQRQAWVMSIAKRPSGSYDVQIIERTFAGVNVRPLLDGDLVQFVGMRDVAMIETGAAARIAGWAFEAGISAAASTYAKNASAAAFAWDARSLRLRALRWALLGAVTDDRGGIVGLALPQRMRTVAGLVAERFLLERALACGLLSEPSRAARLEWHKRVSTPSPDVWYLLGGAEGDSPHDLAAYESLAASLGQSARAPSASEAAPSGFGSGADSSLATLRDALISARSEFVARIPREPDFWPLDVSVKRHREAPPEHASASVVEIGSSQDTDAGGITASLEIIEPPVAKRSRNDFAADADDTESENEH